MSLPLVTIAARQARVLAQAGHRPWPVPAWPWSVAETVAAAATVHWRADAAALAPLLPAGVQADLFGGSAWITAAALRVEGLRVRGLLPLPRLSAGCELVLRTPVLVDGRPGWLVLDSAFSGALAAQAARRLYGLPAVRARVDVADDAAADDDAAAGRPGPAALVLDAARSGSDGAPVVFHARVEAEGPFRPAAPGSLEAFLHERFLLVAAPGGVAAGGPGLVLAEQHRPPWLLAPARAEVALQTALPSSLALGAPACAHLAQPLDQLVWAPERQPAPASAPAPAAAA